MNERFGTIVLDTAFRFMVPFIILYGVYVLINGESSPGGGFQAGALFAIAVILSRLVHGEKAVFNISGNTALILAGIGTFVYGFVGVLTLMYGGNFLEYGVFPMDILITEKHALGILGIETGVTICVMSTFITIFDALVGEEDS